MGNRNPLILFFFIESKIMKQENKIHIKYSPQGLALADARAEFLVIDLIEFYKMDGFSYAHVSTENVIQFMLTHIIEDNLGEIVIFEYDGDILIPNSYGALHDWPKGFCDYTHKAMTKRLRMAVKRAKAERKEKENGKEETRII